MSASWSDASNARARIGPPGAAAACGATARLDLRLLSSSSCCATTCSRYALRFWVSYWVIGRPFSRLAAAAALLAPLWTVGASPKLAEPSSVGLTAVLGQEPLQFRAELLGGGQRTGRGQQVR